MTVEGLIEELQKLPPHLDVIIYDVEYGDYRIADTVEHIQLDSAHQIQMDLRDVKEGVVLE